MSKISEITIVAAKISFNVRNLILLMKRSTKKQNPKTHESARNWKRKFVESYKRFYGVQLDIPRWGDIADKYRVEK